MMDFLLPGAQAAPTTSTSGDQAATDPLGALSGGNILDPSQGFGGFDMFGGSSQSPFDALTGGTGFAGPGDLSMQGTGLPPGLNPNPGNLGGQLPSNQFQPGSTTPPGTTIDDQNIATTTFSQPPPPAPTSPPQGPTGLGGNVPQMAPGSPINSLGVGGVTAAGPQEGAPGYNAVVPFNAGNVAAGQFGNQGGQVINPTGGFPSPASALSPIAAGTGDAAASAPTSAPPPAAAAAAPGSAADVAGIARGGPTSAAADYPSSAERSANRASAATTAAGAGTGGGYSGAPQVGGQPIHQALDGMGIGGGLQRLLGDFFNLLSGHGNPMGAMQDIMALMQMVMGAGGMGQAQAQGGPGQGQVFRSRNGRMLRNLGNGYVQDVQTGIVYDGNGRAVSGPGSPQQPNQNPGFRTAPSTRLSPGSEQPLGGPSSEDTTGAPFLPGAPNDAWQAGRGA